MTISLYAASVPLLRRRLSALSAVLAKGAAFAEARKIEQSVLLQSRLAPDMFPLVRQVQTATDQATRGAARLAGIDLPSFPDVETNFAELTARIDRAIGFLDEISPAQIDGTEDRPITLPLRGGDMKFDGQGYLLGFVIPNVLFHCTVAYAILRHNGVDLGKRDFMGTV